MKTLKISFIAFALLFGITAIAGGAHPDGVLQTAADIRTEIHQQVASFNTETLGKYDASVKIDFTIDSMGKVIFTQVSSNNYTAEKYVKRMLSDVKLKATTSLKDKMYTVTIRYVNV